MEAITVLTSIAVIFLVGLVCAAISSKLRIPNTLLLLLAGIGLGYITYQSKPLISFPPLFFASLALLALAIIVFDGAASLKLREFDSFSVRALKLVLLFAVLNISVLSLVAHFVFGLPWLLSIVFSAIVSGTSPEIVLTMFGKSKAMAIELLKLESIFNTPLTVLLPFVAIDISMSIGQGTGFNIISQLLPFLNKFITGIGAGIVIGLILFKLTQRRASKMYSALVVVVATLLTFVLAENLGGNGVVAVTSLGVLFGALHIKKKESMLALESLVARLLYIFIFVLAGLVIKFPLNSQFIVSSVVLFAAHIMIRYVAVAATVQAPFGERLFITFNASKGIAAVAVIFAFAIYSIPGSEYYIEGISTIIYLALAFVLYSIVLSTVISLFSRKKFGAPAR